MTAGGSSVRSPRFWTSFRIIAGSSLASCRNLRTTCCPSRSTLSSPIRSATQPDARVLRQIADGRRRRAVAIAQLVQQRVDFVERPRAGHPPVRRQPLVHVRDVVVVDPQIQPQVHGRAAFVFEVFALQLADRVFEQLDVHVEANGFDVAALLAAEQIAGAANLEVERGDAEAAAEIAELANRRQPPPRDRRQRLFRWNQQVRVRPPIRSAHAARATGTAAPARTDRRDSR